MVHQPEPEADIEVAWETLRQLQREGKIRYAGVSNFEVGHLSPISRIATPTALQPPDSLIDQAIERAILPYCIENEIGTIAAWTIRRGGVSAAIVGMRRPAHADSIVPAADQVLDRATLDALDAQ